MFDAVRNNKRIVQLFLALITLPFAFFGVESYVRSVGTGDDVAKIGDVKITQQQFQQALREQTGGQFVVSDCALRYRRSARLDDLLIVTASPVEVGKVSLTIAQQALLKPQQPGAQPELLCEGSIRIGWVDAVTLQPRRMPVDVLQRLQTAGAGQPAN